MESGRVISPLSGAVEAEGSARTIGFVLVEIRYCKSYSASLFMPYAICGK